MTPWLIALRAILHREALRFTGQRAIRSSSNAANSRPFCHTWRPLL